MTMRWISAIASAAALLGCSPVPSDMFLTLSISTDGAAVETSINGKANAFLSGDSGSMVTSAPLNKLVRSGENEVSFEISPVQPLPETPGFFSKLEISIKGEIIDTMVESDRTIFARELTAEESAKIADGESITITEKFTIDRAALKAMKN
ncbi:MAG: hypothetical protein KJN99_06315 [Marinicaulis sp.]|nr:hypothetical protein [Marinicaulis sp.]